ncbi:ABC transporter ATP-binding protein [Paenibacillus contaminans]|uniref:ABC transporter ATP-binding protein n=1 Tax=Paenibacillus contaminans TaxID=450362 RepID=A0A329MUK9_9BACL|nr:ABC transporter ATP-binding protein [Paenibacillus contaminans]RAV23372.1 ABC transporter ATP-binding protein [Paenibacillus contaminans]
MEKKSVDSLDYMNAFEISSGSRTKPLHLLARLHIRNWKKLSLAFIFFILRTSPLWLLPIVTANIINIITYPDKYSMAYFWSNLIIIILVTALNVPTHVMYIRYMSSAVRHVEAGLRSTLIRKLQKLSLSYHGDLNAGKIQSKVLRDVEQVDFLSRQIILSVLPACINLVAITALTLVYSWYVAVFFVFLVPIAVVLVRFYRAKITKYNRELRTNIEKMSGEVSETVEMIPVTRAHGLEENEIKKVDHALEGIRIAGLRIDAIEAKFGALGWVFFQFFQVVCLFFTAGLAYMGYMKIGDIMMYQGFFTMMVGYVSQIMNIYPNLMKGFESLYSVSEVLNSDNLEAYNGERKLDAVQGDFQFNEVYFRYEDSEKHAVEKFSLHVRSGEKIGIVGESGAGKSTILNLIIGFYKPQKGQILIDGVPMSELSMKDYRQSLAIVLQNNILFSGTIRENITYGLDDVSDERLQQAVWMANLQDVVRDLPEGMDTSIGEHGGKLSGGQKQRIAIARALVRNPKIIVLDEATSALDNISEKHVQQAMEQLIQGRTTFIVAHRLSTVRNVDRIVVMKKGRIVEVGTYDELMAKQGYFYQMKSS